MTQMCESGWNDRSRDRRSVRDQVHAAFWEEVGAIPAYEQKTVEAAPISQQLPLVRLLQVTRDAVTNQDQKRFLAVIARALRSVRLGEGVMGPVAENIENLKDYHTRSLEHFFTVSYKFEGRHDDESKGS